MCRARSFLAAALAVIALAGCGGEDEPDGPAAGIPTVVVTTNILGDVVSTIVGDAAEVTTIMPVGANPHDFQASAQEAAAMRSADLLIVNGAGFEQGLADVIEGAEEDGVRVIEAIDFVDGLDLAEPADHGDEEADEHGHGTTDPHFFTDPRRMAAAVGAISEALREDVEGIDVEVVEDATGDYLAQLERLDTDIETQLADVAEAHRVLVTNHEVFGYFAERYGFEIVGTVVPGGSTSEGASASGLADLVRVIREHQVKAIFADTSAPDDLAQTLAGEVGDIEVVQLFSESLGKPGSGGATYLEMMRSNATRIAEALR